MLSLILGVVVITFIVLFVLRIKLYKEKKEDAGVEVSIMLVVCVIGAFVLMFFIFDISIEVATESIIDRKIEMYQEENAKIEEDIDKIVKEYLKHEHDTFADLKAEESSIALVNLFPELKSDTLVQQQLEIYVANNEKIRGLKEEKIDLTRKKWLLYFGK